MLGNISSSTCSLVLDIVFVYTLSYIEYDDNVVCFVRLFILAINAFDSKPRFVELFIYSVGGNSLQVT